MAEVKQGVLDKGARALDYIFGRNTLIGIASLMLLAISGYATWHGMRDFIIGVSSTPTAPAPAPCRSRTTRWSSASSSPSPS